MHPQIYIFGAIRNTWNVCTLASFLAVLVAVLVFRPKDFPLKRIQIFWIVILFSLFGILGGNLLNIIIHVSKHKGQTLQEVFNTSGVAYLGFPMLGLLVLWIFCRSVKAPFLICVDYFTPFLMLERIIGRLGCLMHGCCYGIASKLPWAYPFKGWTSRHPTQAYALICALAILVSSRYLYKRIRNVRGVTFFYVILSYTFLRFFNEFLRAQGPFVYGHIKLSYIGLFIFVVIAVIGLFIIIKNSTARNEVLKTLKGAVIRLFAWLLGAGAAILFILSFAPKNV